MASNAQKTPFQLSISRLADKKAGNLIQQLGKALPCSVVSVNGQIVTVKFELESAPFTLPQITIPIATFTYIRYPVQVGDYGVTIPADARLGGLSGLGSGVANLTAPSNLNGLMFLPIANKNWDPPPDVNKLDLNGPDGVTLRAVGGTASITVEADQITFTTSGFTVVVNSSQLLINGNDYSVHKHSGVTTGGGTSGGVVP